MELSDHDEYEGRDWEHWKETLPEQQLARQKMPLSNPHFSPRLYLAWYWWVAIALVCLSLLVFV